jgi:hypothetical protein
MAAAGDDGSTRMSLTRYVPLPWRWMPASASSTADVK